MAEGYLGAGVKKREKSAVSTTQSTTWKLGINFLLLLKRDALSLSLSLCSRSKNQGKKTELIQPPLQRNVQRSWGKGKVSSSILHPISFFSYTVAKVPGPP